ncbi:hypothetical protein WSS15_14670 [Acetobacter pasteurianus]|uniref:hypothetical protein n=1 Tax=Acetobacter pasteurianus TaxID=438 RepID=UPI0022C95338|nr:hypothetical protein [Acetobacter pasteurianus]GLH28817.1 hypothetical protein WSS15_14670 [Acetobacter pasteurianus]
MNDLTPAGQALLKILLPYLSQVVIRGDYVKNCPTYTQILKKVVPTWIPSPGDNAGRLLQSRGLNDLAEWTKSNGHPAITGMIVRQETGDPGEGYYALIANSPLQGWAENIKQSKTYNWENFL